jgi:hypothetical protein
VILCGLQMASSTEPAENKALLECYNQKEVTLDPLAGTLELGSEKNESEETRDKITHIEAFGRSVIGSVTRVNYGSFGSTTACLLCMRFTFRYTKASMLRFKKAEIIVSFDKRGNQALNNSTLKEPVVRIFAPRKLVGKPTEETKKIAWGIEWACSLSAVPVSRGPTLSRTNESTYSKEHYLEIKGIDQMTRKRKQPHIVIWTATEDDLLKSGIPDELNLAVVVEYDGDFQADVSVKVDTPLKDGLYAHVWSKDDPLLFLPPLGKGDVPPTDKFDKLSEADWQSLAPYL